MCGIAGVIKKGARELELKESIARMNNTQKLRGPDDRGFFISEKDGLALGHTRLSILDLSSAGHQPMLYPIPHTLNPNLVITFNGEIYNFFELRKELEGKGYQFKTKTDTEVILAAFAEWGVESFSRLRGMFAFGLWDEVQKKLYLVKDRYGIKPLYYYSKSDELFFASTVKALKACGKIPNKKNEKAAIGFLLFGSVPLPHTTIQNVYGLEAGHYLEVNLTSNLTSSQDVNLSVKNVKYYEPLDYFLRSDVPNIIPLSSDIGSHNIGPFDIKNTIQKIRSLLEESVRLHMISDAPLGVFLSGGIDSSALAILADANLGTSEVPGTSDVRSIGSKRLKTLSIVFDEQEYSEQKYQQIVAKQIKSDHQEYRITKSDFENSIDDIWQAMDEPTIDGVNTYFIAKAAKEAGLKAVLSGLGADEIFFGYPSFRRASMLRKVQKGLSIFGHRKSLGLAMSRTLGFLSDRYAKLDYLRYSDPLRFYLSIRGLFAPLEVAKILNISEAEVNDFIDSIAISYQLSAISSHKIHPANVLSYLELKFYLQNQLLKDSDSMAMHHSVEIRVPFLDHPLVEYISGLSAGLKLKPDIKNLKFKIKNSRPKPLLIASMCDLLPQKVWDRAKMGFTFPFNEWISESSLKAKSYQLKASSHWSRNWALNVISRYL
ncbi:MAG: asparagine synthase (glutamine-hydrolyzing) [bacterium]|nr:asparagine synthase (glutamine-hydrolyzing) [bacterium]